MRAVREGRYANTRSEAMGNHAAFCMATHTVAASNILSSGEPQEARLCTRSGSRQS